MGVLGTTWTFIVLIAKIGIVFCSVCLAVYGLNIYILAYLSGKGKDRYRQKYKKKLERYPMVTIQLPIYNEKYVVKRLLMSVTSIDYPADKIEIQILDDSTDETAEIVQEEVAYYKEQGFMIEYIRRDNREGYKAGALQNGLKFAKGEFIAIFDADFVPHKEFLTDTLPYFFGDEKIGLVQTRWGYVNQENSPITKAVSIAYDGHFLIEQLARNKAKFFMNFNGTGGIWRRECIEDGGGWHGDTIAEDLDLSYRAQMRGWKFLVLPDIITPSEIPPNWVAFKKQQFRWAKGSIQCFKKHSRTIIKSNEPFIKKLQSELHLSYYMVHPLMFFLMLFLTILVIAGSSVTPLMYFAPLAIMAGLGPSYGYLVAIKRAENLEWSKRVPHLLTLLLLGFALSVSNTVAVIQGLHKKGGEFVRTPKYNLTDQEKNWKKKDYKIKDKKIFLEGLFGTYALIGAIIAFMNFQMFWIAGFFLLLFSISYYFSAIMTYFHGR